MMITHVLICSVLVFLTTVVHAGFTICALSALRLIDVDHWIVSTRWRRTLLVAGLVLAMYVAALIEVTLYAGTYLWLGAIEGLERAVYFSMVTFTTLGYGDIVLSEDWRLMASFEAANGIILFGWTTALVVAFVQRVATHSD